MSPRIAASTVTALSLSLLVACGGVRHASRDGLSREARAVELVEVTSAGPSEGHRIVSFSIWDVDLVDDLPADPPKDVVADMREEAASKGAEQLLLERYESDYRKAFYGVGIVHDPTAPKVAPVCGHPAFELHLEEARGKVRACADALRKRRPELRGKVVVAFEIDYEGGVLRAVPTPDSSRDSELQACVLEAVHDTPMGVPLEFTCQARLSVEVAGDGKTP